MAISVRRSRPGDHPAILALMDSARGDDLSPQERAEQGFVQGAMDEKVLAHFEAGTGVFVAESAGIFAGFSMSADAPSKAGAASDDSAASNPAALSADTARAAVGDRAMFLYGPLAVSPDFQGQGVTVALLRFCCQELAADFEVGVVFVEGANQKSLAIHRHLGMQEVPGFEFDGRDYHVLTFNPQDFTAGPGSD